MTQDDELMVTRFIKTAQAFNYIAPEKITHNELSHLLAYIIASYVGEDVQAGLQILRDSEKTFLTVLLQYEAKK